MPNKVGAFLTASKVFAQLGLNVTRVIYNKAVDSHMLFIEAEGERAAMKDATVRLREIGYLPDSAETGNVILIEFHLRDVPGTLEPVLELIEKYNINISYLNSQEDGSGWQNFRMGLFVREGGDISELLKKASELCDLRIINYNPLGISLDNTVFYVSFANKIAELNHLGEKEKRGIMIDSNLIMDILTKKNEPPYKTFDYIGKFAEDLMRYKGDAFCARVSEFNCGGTRITLIEPPCGSNVCLLEAGEKLLCIDGGFSCYRDEALKEIKKLYPDFERRDKALLITHADVDHVGLADCFDEIYVSKKCSDNFICDNEGSPNLRERNPFHAPYVRISKILSHYKPLDVDRLCVIGGKSGDIDGLTEYIGTLGFGELSFECYEARGGHVRGETVFIERRKRILFTGDIIVNIKGFTREQAKFNSLAPFLMTSVDTDPALAALERDEIKKLLEPGKWLIFGGHGAPLEYESK